MGQKKSITVNFAINLKALRSKRGLTQDQLAKELDMSRARIGSYEENRSYPNLHDVVKIARYFDVTTDEIIIGASI